MRPLPIDVIKDIHAEMDKTEARVFPSGDWVRQAALLAEEVGEIAAEALDATRPGIKDHEVLVMERLDKMYREATDAGNLLIRMMEDIRQYKQAYRGRYNETTE